MTGCPARYDEQLGYWVVDDPALAREVLLDPETFRPDNAVLAHTPLSVKALRVLSSVFVFIRVRKWLRNGACM